jgi:anti-anti-sigma regulatory factor
LHDQAFAVLDVDLAGVIFLDCTGLGGLVAARDAAVKPDGRCGSPTPNPSVAGVLEVIGLLDVLTAPTDQPQPPPTRSEYPSRTGPTPRP